MAAKIESLTHENSTLKAKVEKMEDKHAVDLEIMQRKFDKKIIEVYQLIEDGLQNGKKIDLPMEIKENKEKEQTLIEGRFKYLETQVDQLNKNPILCAEKKVNRCGKKILCKVCKLGEKVYNHFILPVF